MTKENSNYAKSWEYLKTLKIYILAVSIVFVFSIFLGYFFPSIAQAQVENIIKQLISQTQGKSFFGLMFFIIENNISTAFLGVILGILFGIFPVVSSILNGYIIGFVLEKSVAVSGYAVILMLFPHGIFELPALIISLAMGMRLGTFIFRKNRKQDFFYNFENALRVFLLIVIPLLLIAGVIETSLIFFVG